MLNNYTKYFLSTTQSIGECETMIIEEFGGLGKLAKQQALEFFSDFFFSLLFFFFFSFFYSEHNERIQREHLQGAAVTQEITASDSRWGDRDSRRCSKLGQCRIQMRLLRAFYRWVLKISTDVDHQN